LAEKCEVSSITWWVAIPPCGGAPAYIKTRALDMQSSRKHCCALLYMVSIVLVYHISWVVHVYYLVGICMR